MQRSIVERQACAATWLHTDGSRPAMPRCGGLMKSSAELIHSGMALQDTGGAPDCPDWPGMPRAAYARQP